MILIQFIQINEQSTLYKHSHLSIYRYRLTYETMRKLKKTQ